MTTDDIPGVIRIENQSFEQPWSPVAFYSYLDGSPGKLARVATIEERIVAFLIAWYIPSSHDEDAELHIHNVAVDQNFRRKGIGRQLIQHLSGSVVDHPALGIQLEVREGNLNARAFYTSLGFRNVARRREYYDSEDAIIMECALDDLITTQKPGE